MYVATDNNATLASILPQVASTFGIDQTDIQFVDEVTCIQTC